MCGIFGCILDGGRAAPIIHSALKRLEYRGYDSVGVATLIGHPLESRLHIKKDAGKIDEIHSRLDLDDMPGAIGIGHTRWATHGAPSMVNAHPHTDCENTIAVVHNGIIDNFAELRKRLEERGHRFRSRTDTEVISHLVEEFLEEGDDLTLSVRRALKELKGSYAIAVLSMKEPDKIVCARKESPLIIGVGDGGVYCASDIPAFLPLTNRAMFVEEGEVVVLRKGSVQILDIETGNSREGKVVLVPWTPEMAEKEGYSYFMLKEIHEQPRALRNVLRTQQLYYNLVADALDRADDVYMVACGTSYHTCLAASYMFSQLAHLRVQPVIASEFVEQYGDSLSPGSVVLAVSQSGETADTLSAVRHAKDAGATVLGITNVMGSTLTRISNVYVGQNSGPEIGVAATKTFTAQLMVLVKIAMTLAEKRGFISHGESEALKDKLLEVPDLVQWVIERNEGKVRGLARKYVDEVSFCFLGRGINTATAMEGRLKLLEVAYTPSLAYPAGESKHGFIAMVQDGYPVVFIAPRDSTRPKVVGNIMEMKARGAEVMAVVEEEDDEICGIIDEKLEIPSGVPDVLMPILCVVPLQLFAAYMAVERGQDPDKPRNLAKSVTVE